MISGDANWLASAIPPSQKERDEAAEKQGGDEEDGPRSGMALVSLTDGTVVAVRRSRVVRVQRVWELDRVENVQAAG